MPGLFEPVAAPPKPKRPQYVLPKTASRGRLGIIVISSAVLWTVSFTVVGYLVAYHFWPWVAKAFPLWLSHLIFASTVSMGFIWGLMSGLRLMRQVIRAGIATGEVRVVGGDNAEATGEPNDVKHE